MKLYLLASSAQINTTVHKEKRNALDISLTQIMNSKLYHIDTIPTWSTVINGIVYTLCFTKEKTSQLFHAGFQCKIFEITEDQYQFMKLKLQ